MSSEAGRFDHWLRALSGAIDAGVLLYSGSRGLEYASPVALDLLGCRTPEELAERWPELRRLLDRALPRPLGDSPRLSADVDVPWEGGKRGLRWLFVRPDGAGELDYVVLLRDRDQIEEVHGELRLAARYLTFSRIFSPSIHDLRGMLNAVVLHLEVLREAVPLEDLSSDARDSLAAVREEIERYTRGFELFVRQSRPPEDARVAFDFAELLREVALLLGPLARRQKVALTIATPPGPIPFTGKRERLLQALVVVALNGFDAMPTGGELAFALGQAEGRLTLSIADTGVGIPPDVAPRIWDIHFSTRKGGTGLGLYVARTMIEEHGGSIGLERTAPSGTSFRVELPLPVEAGAAPAKPLHVSG